MIRKQTGRPSKQDWKLRSLILQLMRLEKKESLQSLLQTRLVDATTMERNENYCQNVLFCVVVSKISPDNPFETHLGVICTESKWGCRSAVMVMLMLWVWKSFLIRRIFLGPIPASEIQTPSFPLLKPKLKKMSKYQSSLGTAFRSAF